MSEALKRFIDAQRVDYEVAFSEIQSGQKRSHWMWYIFPQIAGLAATEISKHYAIKDIHEAEDFLTDEILGPRLINICHALLKLDTEDAYEVFGNPDQLKLKSSMTLFETVPPTYPVFGQVLEKFYQGERDQRTLDIIKTQR